jgi:aminopeptidase N
MLERRMVGLVSAAALLLIGIAAGQQPPVTNDELPPAVQQPPTTYQPPTTDHEPARSPRNASYDIDVRLDHGARTLKGRETIRWRNITAHPTSELQFHLYWNAWRSLESTWLRERRLSEGFTPPRADAWSSMDVTSLKVNQPGAQPGFTPQRTFISPDDGNTADRTVMTAALSREVAPGETIDIEVAWTAKIPRPFARTGYTGDYYFIGQWFPKIGVFEDSGWNAHQFHSNTEFFSDYGVYDVRMTVPRGFVVGASGRQLERTDNADGTTTHRYRGEDIHDFAWTTSPTFIERRETFEHSRLPTVEMRLLLQPEHSGLAERHFAATAAALRYYGEWYGAYPYPNVTIVDPAYQSRSGGMEYPTLFTVGSRWIAPRGVADPESTAVHEAGHQFWYGIVGSNEFENAWMDEGINQFSEARTLDQAFSPNYNERRYFGNFIPWMFPDIPITRALDSGVNGYRQNTEVDAQATPTFRQWPSTSGNITYWKTALWLYTLERHLGWPMLQRIMSTYFERWKFRHPAPADFFQIVNEVSGQDMTWFFDQVYRSSNEFDYGVQRFSSTRNGSRYRTIVVIRRFGEATFPVDIVTTFRNGDTVKERWEGADRRVMYVYDRPSQALSVQVDPNRVLMLDVNYTNNSQTLESRTSEASLKWSLRWMAWLQDLMLTYSFFV